MGLYEDVKDLAAKEDAVRRFARGGSRLCAPGRVHAPGARPGGRVLNNCEGE